MKVLLTGSAGQLGKDLIATVPQQVELIALDRSQLDIGNSAAVTKLITEQSPDLVINAAAYTAVDRAESEANEAHRVNALGPSNIAHGCSKSGSRLIHLSTDYVFDGTANTPYQTDHAAAPRSVYGATKYEGEQSVLATEGLAASVVRVSWLYSGHGANFVKTMLRLMSERTELGVVVDQVGSPTWTRPLAQALWALSEHREPSGVWHWSDLGVASWYDFARAIYEAGHKFGRLSQKVTIRPISSTQYPTPAKRPAYSVLDSTRLRECLNIPDGYWRDHVFELIESGIDE